MNRLILVALFPLFALAIPGCGGESEGPAEQAGKQIDETVEEAKENLSGTVEETAEQVEEAGDELRQSTKD